MSRLLPIILLLTALATADDKASSKHQREAAQNFDRALRLEAENKLDEAQQALDRSAALDPANPAYLTAKEYVRQQRVARHIDAGNHFADQDMQAEALAEFQIALDLDPSNTYATQRLRDVSDSSDPSPSQQSPAAYYASEPELAPKPGKQSFDFRGNTRSLIEAVARAYGISVIFDESVQVRPVRFTLPDVDFFVAMEAARKVSKTFFVPMSPTQILVAADTRDNRNRMERMSLRTFTLSEATTAQDVQELLNTMKAMLETRYVIANPQASTLTIRAPAKVLDAAERVLDQLSQRRPQVMIDVQAFEISEQMARDIGMELPLQFTVFSVATELRNLANAPGLQDLINRLTSGGQLTGTDAAALAALLAAQQNPNSPLFQPFATFGGGTTLMGVVIPPVAFNLNFNESIARSLQHASLRAEQGRPASFRVGTRFPVLTSSFSPVVNIPIPNSFQRSNNLQPIPPSFNYEDLGLTFKATPQVNGDDKVTLQFELSIKGLGAQSFNAVPVITTREYTGSITLKEGEPSVIAGAVTRSEQKSLRGLPYLSLVPGLKYAGASEHKETLNSQILLVVTPRIISPARRIDQSRETWLSDF